MSYNFWTGDKIRLRAVELKDAGNLYKWASDYDDEFKWAIENTDGVAVGNINTFDCNRRFGTFKYGLGIVREHWGKGYAKEAIKIVLRYQKVTVYVYFFNQRSMKLHESLGFQQEGRIRRAGFTNGSYYDEVIYGMTCEEFDATDKKSELEGV